MAKTMKMREPMDFTRRIVKASFRKNGERDEAFRQVIRSIPKGKVSTYGKVAAASGYGRTLHVAFFKAAHELNPELELRYGANRLGLTRQLRYSQHCEKSLDMTICFMGKEGLVEFAVLE
jgi:hypothetical protein